MEDFAVDQPAPQYPIEAVDKALRLLSIFGQRSQLRLTDAYEELGITKSRAHRLLAMLVYHCFVVQDSTSKVYRPGPALVEIGLATVNRIDIRELARPTLEQIAAVTGETVHLASLEGAQVRFLDCVESQLALRVANRVGRVLPAHAASVGKAMLAQLPAESVQLLYPTEALAPVTAHTIRRRSELLAELERVRVRGYALNCEESEDGVRSIGVAVIRNNHEPPAGLSIAAPIARLTEQQIEHAATLLSEGVQKLQKLYQASSASRPQ